MKDQMKIRGIVERKLVDANGMAKKQFKENSLWRVFNQSGFDIRVHLITGYWTVHPIKCNTITALGKQVTAQQLGGTTTAPVTAIAIGIGTPSTTALGSEITTNGGQRGASAVSNVTTTTTGDTEQLVKTFTFTGSFAITEEALFDNNASGGNMVASQSFAAINVISSDSLTITHKIIMS